MIKKVVIIGPESTGKSTLCQMLSQHYGAPWCREYAREYLMTNGTDYNYDNLLTMAKGQVALEDEVAISFENTLIEEKITLQSPISNLKSKNQAFLFIDTDLYVMKVWCEYVFNDCHSWILKRIAERPYDLYLLCRPDLPWIKDELREYPNEKPRQELYHIYKDLLVQQATPWAEVYGNFEERLERAIEAIEMHLVKAF